MPMLGDILGDARREAAGSARWIAARDPQLSGRIAAAAAAADCSPTAFVRSAVVDFERHASEEDWAHLTSALRDSPDPGSVCLLAMLRWRLADPGRSEDHSRGKDR